MRPIIALVFIAAALVIPMWIGCDRVLNTDIEINSTKFWGMLAGLASLEFILAKIGFSQLDKAIK